MDQSFHADYIRLQNKVQPLSPKASTLQKLERLKSDLQIDDPYVIVNINCKKHETNQKRRGIQHPERYNSLIDALIDNGLNVVIQGRSEQPAFRPRPKLIDYSKTNHCSMENDFALYSGCVFSIVSKSGPDSFNAVFDKPFLELNVVEFCYCRPGKKGRYFFKHVFSKEENRFIPWSEVFASPIYFEASDLIFDEEIEYIEMSEEEIFQSGTEFLKLVSGRKEWDSCSENQHRFKSLMTPLHLDHFHTSSVPCDHYLDVCSYNNRLEPVPFTCKEGQPLIAKKS